MTFAIGSALAAAAGILFGVAYPVLDPYMGIVFGWKAFVAAILGGRGSILGATLAGFLLGFIEIFRGHGLPLDPAGPDRLLDHPAHPGLPAPRLFRRALQRAVTAAGSRPRRDDDGRPLGGANVGRRRFQHKGML
jgi:ABC-type branched-subunit amino acid transport system permease subunit